jgi:uncharacterized protein
MDIILSLLALGIIVGILAGLLGIGGGLIIVPVIVWLFKEHPNFAPDYIFHVAIGTSLATIVITSISSSYAHHRHKAVRWDLVWKMLAGLLLGGIIGAIIVHNLSYPNLKFVFAIFVLLAAIKMLFDLNPTPARSLLPNWGLNLAGLIIGMVAAIVGIGGGVLSVPFLTWCKVPIRQAVATASACGVPIAVAGSLGFIITGWQIADLPPWSVGYVYLPAFLIIVTSSIIFAPLGAKLAHTLPTARLKQIFAILLCIIGINMLL